MDAGQDDVFGNLVIAELVVGRRFVALSAERMKQWMAADLSNLDLLIIQIDGIHIDEDLMLLAAVGIDGNGEKHPLGVIEGATENTAVVQALLDNLVGRGLEAAVAVIIDGAKALSKAIRNTFEIQPCPQGPQHERLAKACQRPQSAAPMGTGRRRQGRAADQELGAAPGT